MPITEFHPKTQPKIKRPFVPKRNISGILLLDKPEGISSSGALVKTRGIYRALKGGHTGSLDPLASGLLPVCLGEAAKFSSYFLEGKKKYIATGLLGKTTTTCDREGEIVAERPIGDAFSRLHETLLQFTGKITQVPPIYSAVKVDGKPLYKYARQGKDVEIPKREIEIYSIKLIETTDDSFTVEVYCSKGTYIRTLISDIGEALGCGAYVTMLRRTYVEGLPENSMISLEKLQELADSRENPTDFTELDKLLYPLDLAVNNLPLLSLPYNMAKPLTHGVRQGPNLKNAVLPEQTDGPMQVRCEGIFIGVCELKDSILIPLRMMAPECLDTLRQKQ